MKLLIIYSLGYNSNRIRKGVELNNSAFSLLEISLSLLMLGLIVGAVTVGQTIIESGKISNQVLQIQKYSSAINNFVDKYEYKPGDFPNAVEILGASTDGNGDNSVGTFITTYSGADIFQDGSDVNSELSGAFQHLSLANFVAIGFDGSTDTWRGNVNFPELQLGEGLLVYHTFPKIFELQQTSATDLDSSDYFYLGVGYNPSGVASDMSYKLNPSEAEKIDRKIDDGLPLTGKTIAVSDYYALAAYDNTDDEQFCLKWDGSGRIEGRYKNNLEVELCNLKVRIF